MIGPYPLPSVATPLETGRSMAGHWSRSGGVATRHLTVLVTQLPAGGSMPAPWPLRFGVFYAPFHPVGQNPTLALEYDLERVVALDALGYDEAWFGEHHSGGYEIIACPEIFIAAAAERTKHIRLGTGVVSLPYHHPWLVADRLVLLDHLTRGRMIFGAGPGALPSDAFIMGIDPVNQRRMMEESLEAILALLRSDEPVTRETDWFTMREARLQVRPYTHPHFDVAVAAMVSPSGPRLAGTYGVSLLSLSMSLLEGFAAVGQAWQVVEDMAARTGQPAPDRQSWRVLGIMHLADTKDQAIEECTYGLEDFANYFGGGAGFVPLANTVSDAPKSKREFVEEYAASGNVVIGTPDDAIAYIEGLLEQSGGFGTFLLLGHDWADPDATMRSFRLFAREVVPYFKGQLDSTRTSHEWAISKREHLFGRAGQAIMDAISTHVEESSAANNGGPS
jgi:limonene 1,2-monooxygenase